MSPASLHLHACVSIVRNKELLPVSNTSLLQFIRSIDLTNMRHGFLKLTEHFLLPGWMSAMLNTPEGPFGTLYNA